MRNSQVANICATFELRKFVGDYFFEELRRWEGLVVIESGGNDGQGAAPWRCGGF